MQRLFLSAAGAGNLGDDLLLIEHLRSQGTVKRSISATFGSPYFESHPFFKHTNVVHWNDLLNINLDKTTRAVVAGGSFIWSEEQVSNLLNVQEKVLRTGGDFNLACVHVDAGTIDLAPTQVRQLLAKSRRVTVRDEISRVNLSNLMGGRPYPRTEDPVFSRAKKLRGTRVGFSKSNKIGISLASINQEIESLVGRLTIDAKNRGYEVIYVEQVNHKLTSDQVDAAHRERLCEITGLDIPFETIPAGFEEAYKRLHKFGAIITSRNHMALMATGVGVPIVGVIGGGIHFKGFFSPSKREERLLRILAREDPAVVSKWILDSLDSTRRKR